MVPSAPRPYVTVVSVLDRADIPQVCHLRKIPGCCRSSLAGLLEGNLLEQEGLASKSLHFREYVTVVEKRSELLSNS